MEFFCNHLEKKYNNPILAIKAIEFLSKNREKLFETK